MFEKLIQNRTVVSIPFRRWPLSNSPASPDRAASQSLRFQSPFGDGRFLTGQKRDPTAIVVTELVEGFNPLSEMAAF